jgi:protein-disulfide isomerase
VSEHRETNEGREHLREELSAQGEVRDKATRATRRRRLRHLALVVTLTAAMVFALVVTVGSSGSAPPSPGSSQAAIVDREIDSLLNGIPQNANVLGRPTAPVTIQWFGDLECPFCREFALGALPTIIRKWVRGGQLKLVYRSMETATHNTKIFKIQQAAALAAGIQNKMWNFIELFYHEQGHENSGYVTEEYLQGLAQQIPGLYPSQWDEDRTNPELLAEIKADNQTVERYGFIGTPSFLIGKTKERMTPLGYSSLTDPALYNEAIRRHLAEQRLES